MVTYGKRMPRLPSPNEFAEFHDVHSVYPPKRYSSAPIEKRTDGGPGFLQQLSALTQALTQSEV